MDSHEDIRHHVVHKLEKAILDAIKEIGEEEPELYYKLGLEEYKKIIEEEKHMPLIIKNERSLKGIGRVDIEVFGGKIIVEVKVKDSEFPEAYNKLKNYISFYPNAEHCIITNDNKWIIYNHELKKEKELIDIIKELKEIIKPIIIRGIKIIPSTENIRKLFQSIMLFEEDLLEIFKNSETKNSALFEAYSNIISRLYEGIPKEIAIEIETMWGTGDPIGAKINPHTVNPYFGKFKGELWLVIPNLQALLYARELLKLRHDYKKDGLNLEVYITDVTGKGAYYIYKEKREPGLIKLVDVLKFIRRKE
jgi:hypothetical protein